LALPEIAEPFYVRLFLNVCLHANIFFEKSFHLAVFKRSITLRTFAHARFWPQKKLKFGVACGQNAVLMSVTQGAWGAAKKKRKEKDGD